MKPETWNKKQAFRQPLAILYPPPKLLLSLLTGMGASRLERRKSGGEAKEKDVLMEQRNFCWMTSKCKDY